ncbi:hypothetical protein [Cupriavidus necator]
MLSSFAKFLLALTAMSPVALTWAVADYGRRGYDREQLIVIGIAAILALCCMLVLQIGTRSLTKISFSVEELKAVDNEVVAYIVTYLFPLIAPASDISVPAQALVLGLLALVLSTSNAFTFNPVLSLLGYHFYEVKCSSGVSYLLLSRSDITDVKMVQKVGRLSKHLMLDLTKQ